MTPKQYAMFKILMIVVAIIVAAAMDSYWLIPILIGVLILISLNDITMLTKKDEAADAENYQRRIHIHSYAARNSFIVLIVAIVIFMLFFDVNRIAKPTVQPILGVLLAAGAAIYVTSYIFYDKRGKAEHGWDYWVPRIVGLALGIFFVAYGLLESLSLGGFGGILEAILIGGSILALVALAWKWEALGGMLIFVVGAVIAIMGFLRGIRAATLFVAVPLIVAGAMFVISSLKPEMLQTAAKKTTKKKAGKKREAGK